MEVFDQSLSLPNPHLSHPVSVEGPEAAQFVILELSKINVVWREGHFANSLFFVVLKLSFINSPILLSSPLSIVKGSLSIQLILFKLSLID